MIEQELLYKGINLVLRKVVKNVNVWIYLRKFTTNKLGHLSKTILVSYCLYLSLELLFRRNKLALMKFTVLYLSALLNFFCPCLGEFIFHFLGSRTFSKKQLGWRLLLGCSRHYIAPYPMWCLLDLQVSDYTMILVQLKLSALVDYH